MSKSPYCTTKLHTGQCYGNVDEFQTTTRRFNQWLLWLGHDKNILECGYFRHQLMVVHDTIFCKTVCNLICYLLK